MRSFGTSLIKLLLEVSRDDEGDSMDNAPYDEIFIECPCIVKNLSVVDELWLTLLKDSVPNPMRFIALVTTEWHIRRCREKCTTSPHSASYLRSLRALLSVALSPCKYKIM